jgi:hypothetical protein
MKTALNKVLESDPKLKVWFDDCAKQLTDEINLIKDPKTITELNKTWGIGFKKGIIGTNTNVVLKQNIVEQIMKKVGVTELPVEARNIIIKEGIYDTTSGLVKQEAVENVMRIIMSKGGSTAIGNKFFLGGKNALEAVRAMEAGGLALRVGEIATGAIIEAVIFEALYRVGSWTLECVVNSALCQFQDRLDDRTGLQIWPMNKNNNRFVAGIEGCSQSIFFGQPGLGDQTWKDFIPSAAKILYNDLKNFFDSWVDNIAQSFIPTTVGLESTGGVMQGNTLIHIYDVNGNLINSNEHAVRQSTPTNCGKATVAYVVNKLMGTSLVDTDISSQLQMELVTRTKLKWESPNFDQKNPNKTWSLIQSSLDRGIPVIIGLGGQFSASGYGHIIPIIGIQGDYVYYMDPADSKNPFKKVTKKDIEDAPGHTQGKFLFIVY